MPVGSKIFTPSRSLGYVSNQIPLSVRFIKNLKENLVVTCVGKAFHTYSISHFSLLSVSGLHPEDISCMCSDSFHVYTACGNNIYAWRRGTELKHTYKGHEFPIRLMLPFGCHLITIDNDCILKIWDIKNESILTELKFDKSVFNISVLMHPATYINKILLASDNGQMQLWNINKGKMIYAFKGWEAGITCIEQSTAIDIVAVGLETGDIFLHHLKQDETIIRFKQEWGAVKSISFRTDDQQIMATGSTFGHIVFWDLDEKRVSSQLLAAHDGPVTGMECLPNEPLIVTSSPDNTLKLWIFDMPDGGARLLRIREGHSASPGHIRFHGPQNILSAAGDSSLRIFNLQTERFNKSLGKASYNRKSSKKRKRGTADLLIMPPIIDFTAEPARDKDWDNIAAIHRGLSMTTTWSYDKKKMGDLKLIPERFYKKNLKGAEVAASSLCQTQCGNFVLVGYNNGYVDRFNMQSGLWRDSYGDPKAHILAVRGIAVDALNQIVATGGAEDGIIKFFRFTCKGRKHIHQLDVAEPIRFFRFQRDGGILAACLENFTIILIDLEITEVIRKFEGHIGPLTDATFSPDCRWLITSSTDCSIRTWSIPTGQLVDQFSVEAIPVSIDMSPSGDVLATAHVDYLGIFLWTNKGLYQKLILKGLTPEDTPPLIDLPQILQDNLEDNENNKEIDLSADTIEYESPEQIKENLLTLSGVPTSRWQNLLNLDVIKQRNKPKSPIKTPKNAPFFLPTVTTLNDFEFNLEDNSTSKNENNSKLLISTLTNYTAFGKLLKETIGTNNFKEIMERLKTFSPSVIDFEINSLAPDGGGSMEIMLQFLKFIEATMISRKDFELAESYLSVFLRKHHSFVTENETLRNFLPNLIKCHSDVWNHLEEQIMYCTSVVQFLKTK